MKIKFKVLRQLMGEAIDEHHPVDALEKLEKLWSQQLQVLHEYFPNSKNSRIGHKIWDAIQEEWAELDKENR